MNGTTKTNATKVRMRLQADPFTAGFRALTLAAEAAYDFSDAIAQHNAPEYDISSVRLRNALIVADATRTERAS